MRQTQQSKLPTTTKHHATYSWANVTQSSNHTIVGWQLQRLLPKVVNQVGAVQHNMYESRMHQSHSDDVTTILTSSPL